MQACAGLGWPALGAPSELGHPSGNCLLGEEHFTNVRVQYARRGHHGTALACRGAPESSRYVNKSLGSTGDCYAAHAWRQWEACRRAGRSVRVAGASTHWQDREHKV